MLVNCTAPGEVYLPCLWQLARHQGLGWSLQGALSFGGALAWQYPPSLDCRAAHRPPRRHGGEGRPSGAASPLPHGPRGRLRGAMTNAANYIPRLLTHDILSGVAILDVGLCYHFAMGFAHFLSPGSAVWAVRCEADRGINLTLEKKHWEEALFLTWELLSWVVSQSRSAQEHPNCHASTSRGHHTTIQGWEWEERLGVGRRCQ